MKIQRIAITNLKCFNQRVEFFPKDGLNIFIGPNGGGKSTFLDIVNYAFGSFFLTPCRISQEGPRRTLRQYERFDANQIKTTAAKHYGNGGIQSIEIDIISTESDVNNIKAISRNIDLINDYIHRNGIDVGLIRPMPDDTFKEFSIIDGQTFSYEIVNGAINYKKSHDELFLTYMNNYNLYALLLKETIEYSLSPCFLFIPPDRHMGNNGAQINLSTSNKQAIMDDYAKTTSQDSKSLLNLALHYISSLRRTLESKAKETGFSELANNNPVLNKITEYITALNYNWKLELIDPDKNIYSFLLTKGGISYDLQNASSGEKEIISIILGIFALQINTGIILFDEPELHLHPKWQTKLISLLNTLANDMKIQILLTTHSAQFVSTQTISHVHRIYKENKSSKISSYTQTSHTTKDIVHMINSHNNERIFFGDIVVLVEGITDKIFFEALIERHINKIKSNVIIEIVETHGKNDLDKYHKLLDSFNIQNYIIADLDYIKNLNPQGLSKFLDLNQKKLDRCITKDKHSSDRISLMHELKRATSDQSLDRLSCLYQYLESRHKHIKNDLTQEEKLELHNIIERYYSDNIFILKHGDVEDYLPKDSNSLELLIQNTSNGVFYNSFESTVDIALTSEIQTIVRTICQDF
jgi:predicted ATP-dependent endonuclease of OLD family